MLYYTIDLAQKQGKGASPSAVFPLQTPEMSIESGRIFNRQVFPRDRKYDFGMSLFEITTLES